MTEEKKNEVAVKQDNAVVERQESYISMLLKNMQEDFVAANAGLDMDFVHMGTWLIINKKANFVEADDDSVVYGDTIDLVVGQGEQRWSLWGQEGSPEDGRLIVACQEQDDAVAALQAWLEENPEAATRYKTSDIQLRYMAFVVPVATLGGEDFPKIYLMSFSPTATITWGKWAFSVYQGKYKTKGIPARTGINKIVTRITTVEREGKGNNSYIGLEFDAVGMFNPADYGIEQ